MKNYYEEYYPEPWEIIVGIMIVLLASAILFVMCNTCRRQCTKTYVQEEENETNETERSPSPVTRTVEHRNSILSEVSGKDTPAFQNYAFQSTDNL